MPQLIMVDVPRENVWQLETADTRTVYAQRSNGNVTAFDSHFRYDMRLPIIYDADRDVFKTSCWELEFARDG
ncbi:MAG: hypothetical protein ACYTGL_25720, partial [Planctomycetota bacterium]